jgi:hypothetical protein
MKPTSGGSSAATKPRKIQKESSRSSGNAISSAFFRSELVIEPTWLEMTGPPPR